MATHITLDSIETNQNFDLTKLYDSQHNFLDNDDKYLSIFNQNCQSINEHWDNFKQQIIELENNKLKFDVIGLTETFRLIAPVKHCSLEGYHPFISKVRPPNDDKRGGNKLKFDVIGLTETFRLIAPVEHFSLEGYHPFI